MGEAVFRIGNGAGFSGDRVDAPVPVVDTLVASGGPAAIFFEVLGERTVALAQLEKRRDPARGYEPMLERLLEPILAKCARHGIAIVGNFGAANPPGAARAIAALARRLGLPGLRIATIEGDDIRFGLLAIKNVGKQDPKRHLEESVDILMTSNIVQCMGAMLSTVVFK